LYNPAVDLPVNALPAIGSGHLTFGCLNSPGKLNAGLFKLWGNVLAAIPQSRFIAIAGAPSQKQKIEQAFVEAGINSDRIDVIAQMGFRDYLRQYGRIDIALDTFPYNGHTTTLDALWMGVPVITLVGSRAVSRGGLSLLTNLNLAELAAKDESDFVKAATRLAADLPRLSELRNTLRSRLLNSPLANAAEFARNLEVLYRQTLGCCQTGAGIVKA
jgi:protein O-GlcNAc transferase